MISTMFGALGGALAKTAASAVADSYNKKASVNENKNTTSNTQTKTPTYNTTSTKTNENADYINQNYSGGLDAYTKTQQDRYNQALKDNNVDLINRLNADAQKVGYNLTNQNVVSQFNAQPYIDRLNEVYEKFGNYESKLANTPYPNFDKYSKKMDNIQGDLTALIGALETYQGADSMSMDESMARAYAQLNGIYNANLDKTLENYNKDAISRGMFGQLPVEALKQNAISESELNKASATNDLASNLYSQDYSRARQKDSDFYNNVNQQASLLSNLYNTEADQYQNAVNEYMNSVNLANMKDSNYYDDISRQLDLINNQYNASQQEKQNTLDTLGAYSNDYQARINQLTNDNDTSNDWQIPYLQSLRNDKISSQQSAQAQAESDSQKQMIDLALDVFKQTGVASDWIAETLGINPGTYTADYADKLADNYRASQSKGSSSSSDSSGDDEPSYNTSDLITEARLLANSLYPDGYTTDQYNQVFDLLKQMYTGEMSDSQLADMLSEGTSDAGTGYYSHPLLDYIRNTYK